MMMRLLMVFLALLLDHGRAASPNSGWLLAAAASATGVLLENPGHYRLAGGEHFPTVADMQNCQRLIAICVTLFLLTGVIAALLLTVYR